jgi:hypothetical protein
MKLFLAMASRVPKPATLLDVGEIAFPPDFR